MVINIKNKLVKFKYCSSNRQIAFLKRIVYKLVLTNTIFNYQPNKLKYSFIL